MDCERIQEELELLLGQDELSDDVQQHLDRCPDCSKLHAELSVLREHLMDCPDEFNPDELERAARSVDRRVQTTPVAPIISLKWVRRLSRVAAAVLVVAVSYGGYMIGERQTVAPDAETQLASSDGSYLGLSQSYDDEEDIDDEVVSLLIEDYSTGRYFGGSEVLLDDLTDEEMDYLTENLSLGGLL